MRTITRLRLIPSWNERQHGWVANTPFDSAQDPKGLMPPRSNNTRGFKIFLLTVRAFFGCFIPGLLQSHICFYIATSGLRSNQTCNVTRVFDLDLELVRIIRAMRRIDELTFSGRSYATSPVKSNTIE